jgi:type IV pilus assembly protein PilM
MGLFRKKDLLGLDIGSNSIKAVEFDWKKTPKLKNYGKIALPPEAIVDGALMDSASIVDSIRSLVEGLKIKTKNVAVSVSGHSVYTKAITVPVTPEDQLEQTIIWEAGRQIPFDIEDVKLDYQILDEPAKADQMSVLLVAAKKEMIDDYKAVIEEAGLFPAIVDVDVFAIENAFNLNYESTLEEVIALVNIGASVMNINILKGGISAFTRDVSMGGRQITEEIQKRLKMTYEEAEAIKIREKDAGSQNAEIEQIIQSMVEPLAQEVRRSWDFFQATSAGEDVKKIYLSGGCAKIQMLPSMIEEKMDTPVEVFNPFTKVDFNPDVFDPEYLKQVAPLAAVAVGLALRREDLK